MNKKQKEDMKKCMFKMKVLMSQMQNMMNSEEEDEMMEEEE